MPGALFGGAPKVPQAAPPPPPPKLPDAEGAGSTLRQRTAGMAGVDSTIKTGPQGLTDTAAVASKTLLGS